MFFPEKNSCWLKLWHKLLVNKINTATEQHHLQKKQQRDLETTLPSAFHTLAAANNYVHKYEQNLWHSLTVGSGNQTLTMLAQRPGKEKEKRKD